MANAYQWLEQAKNELKRKQERITLYGERVTKADTLALIESVLEDLEEIDLDSMHDDCCSSDQIQEYCQEAIRDHESEKERKLARLDPEEHRARFGILNGGAA